QHPSTTTGHCDLNPANLETVFVYPGFPHNQFWFAALRLKPENIAFGSIDAIGSHITELVIILIERSRRALRIFSAQLGFVVEDPFYDLFAAPTAGVCLDNIRLLSGWEVLHLGQNPGTHA